MSDEDFIDIQNVTKKFGSVVAVNNTDLKVRRGEFFSLLGSSGCGKTTLLRMLAGFEFPSEGEIFIDGQAMSDVAPNKRPTNMVFQNYAIFPHLTVKDNILYGLRKSGMGKSELDAMAEDSLAKIQLAGYGDRRSDQLSGGQRQRVALARALIMRPKVLLLDEPLGALDKKLREEMQLELRQLQQEVGITFVFVTHDQEEALSMSDRIAVMSAGNVLQVASPKDLYEHPDCVEVASFIGSMNLFDAKVSSVQGQEARVESAGLGAQVAVIGTTQSFVKQGQDIVAAIRPEKIRIATEQPTDANVTSIQGTLQTSAYLGDRSHHYVHIEGRDTPVSVAAQKFDRDTSNNMNISQSVWLYWPKESLILLPKD
jgi:spermidine/putrescine ABC transporter ATP-binding subunit